MNQVKSVRDVISGRAELLACRGNEAYYLEYVTKKGEVRSVRYQAGSAALNCMQLLCRNPENLLQGNVTLYQGEKMILRVGLVIEVTQLL